MAIRMARVETLQVVRRPQSGVPGTDDHHIDREIARQALSASTGRGRPEASRARTKQRVGRSSGTRLRNQLTTALRWRRCCRPRPAGSRIRGTNAGVRFWDGRAWTGLCRRAGPRAAAAPDAADSRRVGRGHHLAGLARRQPYLLEAISGFEWPIAVYVTILAIVGYVPALMWCWYASRRWGTGRFRTDVGFKARGPMPAGDQSHGWRCLVDAGCRGRADHRRVEDPVHEQRQRRLRLCTPTAATSCRCWCSPSWLRRSAEEIVFRGVVLRGLLSRNGAVVCRSVCRVRCSGWPTSTRSRHRQHRAHPRVGLGWLRARRCGVPLPPHRHRR